MLSLLQKRRSIRRFEQRPVEDAMLQQVLQAGLLSPSSRGRNPWEFVVVQDQQVLEQLGACRHPQQAFLPKTPAAIVVLGDTSVTDVWIEDCSIATVVMQLEAERLGLGSCWVQIRNRMAQGEAQTSEALVRQLLEIPEHYAVLSILALGWPAEEKPGKSLEELQYEKVHRERFSQQG